MTIYLKALGPGREAINGGTGTWPEPGTWTHDVDPIPCEQGWHVCTPTQMLQWLPDTSNDIWLCEIDGATIDADDKTVAQRARLTRKLDWSDRSARLFAADCAEAVLPIYEAAYPDDARPRNAIEAARQYANGEISAAAWAAAGAAARAAAGAAAWDAAWGAAKGKKSYDAQYKAAYAVVREKLAPTQQPLQQSALELLDRLIAVGKVA